MEEAVAAAFWRVCRSWLRTSPGASSINAEKIDNRDFAIDTCYPIQNEIMLAEARARRFWAKHSSRFGAEPRFLAVDSKIFPGEVQLINCETIASFFSHGDRFGPYIARYIGWG
jgi:hypothetical protein